MALGLGFGLGGAGLCRDAAAWGGDGHRVVGAMADQLIKGSAAQRQVAALLAPGESLEKIANWADCVKGTFCGPQSADMLAYTAANPQHAQYHYTDIPFQNTHYRDHAVGSAGDDVVQILKQAIAVLQDKGDGAGNPHGFSKRQALLLITHLCGDIHQPLHVGAAYVGKDGSFVVPDKSGQIDAVNMFDARGGNNLLLDEASVAAAGAAQIPAPAGDGEAKPAPAQPAPATRPFHAYWDSTVVDYAMRRIGARTPERFAKLAIAAKPEVTINRGDPDGWPYQWADQTLAAAKSAYAGVTVGARTRQLSKKGEAYHTWALQVPDDYPVPSSALAKTQLIEAGYHLAALLQAIWPEPAPQAAPMAAPAPRS